MSEKTKGILCIIFSALSFAFMSLFIKLSGDIPTLQKSFFRNFVAALVAFAMLKKNHTPLKCSKESFKYVFGRAFFGTVGIFCNFYGVDHLNIADASMLNKLSPFFAIIFSFLDNSVTNRIISCPSPKASSKNENARSRHCPADFSAAFLYSTSSVNQPRIFSNPSSLLRICASLRRCS